MVLVMHFFFYLKTSSFYIFSELLKHLNITNILILFLFGYFSFFKHVFFILNFRFNLHY
jgi:hypothetical protein